MRDEDEVNQVLVLGDEEKEEEEEDISETVEVWEVAEQTKYSGEGRTGLAESLIYSSPYPQIGPV